MTSSLWRAAAIPIPNGVVAIDVASSGQFTQHVISLEQQGVTHNISSPEELMCVLSNAQVSGRDLALTDPVAFGYLMCVLTNRTARILPITSSLWLELERHFSLMRAANQPRIEDEKLIFLVSPQHMPVLKVNQVTVKLRTLQVTEESLISEPWPPESKN